MTFKEWLKTFEVPGIPVQDITEYIGKAAWNAALDEAASIIGDMEGCTDVDYCRRHGLKELEELR